MKAVDRAAMKAAIERKRGESPADRARIDEIIAKEGFEEAGETAAYSEQCRNLNLRPWQPAPMWAQPCADGPDDGIMGWKQAELLLQRLLASGLSKYEPDPLGALERIERESAA
jgi:hypothetical protein